MTTAETIAAPRSWRDHLRIHPAAELFPLMDSSELRALAEDIQKNGLRSPATLQLDEVGNPILLDGRNRLDALALLSEEITLDNSFIFDTIQPDTDPYAYVVSANIRRRHLKVEERDDLIAVLLKADPTKSNRQIAKMVKASHPHVAKVRDRAEKAGDVETVSTSIDTKGRKQPAKRKAAVRKAVAPSIIDLEPGEYHVFQRQDQDIVDQALQLVRQMDPEQRQRFIAQLEVTYGAVAVS